MRRTLRCLLAAIMVAAPVSAQDDPADTARTFVERSGTLGFFGEVLIARGDDVLLHELVEPPPGVEPAPIDALYDVGSIAKQFTAAAILALDEDGRLDLSDPVSKFYPDAPEPIASATIEQIIRHESGINPSVEFNGIDLRGRDATIERILGTPPVARPGERFAYANTGYFVLAAIVEQVSGQPFEEYVRERLFERAGLDLAGFSRERFDESLLPMGHQPVRAGGGYVRGWRSAERVDRIPYAWGHRGATGMILPLDELFRWTRALRDGAVLSDESLDTIVETGVGTYGLGWNVNVRPDQSTALEHGGSTIGFEAYAIFVLDPDDKADDLFIACASNGRNGRSPQIAGQLLRIFDAQPTELPPEWPDEPIVPDESWGGTYEFGNGGRMLVEVLGRSIVVSALDQRAANVFIAPTEDFAWSLGRLNFWALESLTGWIEADEEGMDVYRGRVHPRVPESAVDAWADQWSSAGRPDDPLVRVEAVQTSVTENGLETGVRLVYASGEELVRVFWSGEQIYGIGPIDRPPGARWFTLESEDSGAWIDERIGWTWRIERDGDSLRVRSAMADAPATPVEE